jgi:hypothetical protein
MNMAPHNAGPYFPGRCKIHINRCNATLIAANQTNADCCNELFTETFEQLRWLLPIIYPGLSRR